MIKETTTRGRLGGRRGSLGHI